MKPVTRLTVQTDAGEKFFGPGPARLLRGVEKTGSLRSAAQEMDMAYTKALKILRNAEEALGFALTARTAGGRSGGGSVLTEQGRAFLCRYEAYADACDAVNRQLFRRHFPKIGCIVMASGESKRFGSNKLLADFDGKPLFLQALKAGESLKAHRIVVTRHREVAEICRQMGVEVLLHDLPHRNDTIRLGLTALGDVDGCFCLPADQPLLRRETVDALAALWENDPEKIVRPFHQDTPGAPVLFPRWSFPALLSLPEGQGGSWVIRQHPECVAALSVDDPLELADADTPEALEELRRHIAK